jgi:homoserine kinase
LGAALALHNIFTVSYQASDCPVMITAIGAEADRVSTDTSNLVYQAMMKFHQQLGQPLPPVAIEIQLGVPLARGLGSSATAIVAGLVSANALAGSPCGQTELLELAVAIEGHPDNVVPAMLGGCYLAATDAQNQWQCCPVPWHEAIVPVVASPNYELSTKAARQVLPQQYSRADAIFNTAHLGLLLRALETGNSTWLRAALQDRLHQPYRRSLIPGYDIIETAAMQAGAYGLVISGAGPTLLALTSPELATVVAIAMQQAWASQAIDAEARALPIDTNGTTIVC